MMPEKPTHTSKLELDSPAEKLCQQAEELSGELWSFSVGTNREPATIQETSAAFREYLARGRWVQRELKYRAEVTDEHSPIAVPVTLALAEVKKRCPIAAELLRVCAFLESDAIPEEIFLAGTDQREKSLSFPTNSRWKLATAISAAGRYSLLRRHPNSRTLSLTRQVQVTVQNEMKEDERRGCAEIAVRLLNRAFPVVEYDNWPQCARLVPHVQKLAEAIDEFDFVLPEAARLLHQAGYYLLESAQYEYAEPLLRHSLQIDEKIFGPDHPRVATALNNLATLLKETDRLMEAERLLRRAWQIDEASLGSHHPNVATDLNNLATLLQATDRMTEAESLMRRALQIDEISYGTNHPRVAIDLNNLATLLQATSRLSEAEFLLRRAVDIFENAYGPDHPHTCVGVENYHAILSELA